MIKAWYVFYVFHSFVLYQIVIIVTGSFNRPTWQRYTGKYAELKHTHKHTYGYHGKSDRLDTAIRNRQGWIGKEADRMV